MREQPARPGIAVLGCGQWGINHVRTWRELGVLRVVCDADGERLESARERFPDIETTTSTAEVLGRPDVDAVVVATPAPTHAAIALDALAAGKDVLVEKPLAVTLDEAEAVAAAAEQAGRVLMVGHVLEYHPAVVRLKELVDAGDLGKVRYVYSHRLNFGRVRVEENALWSFAPHDLAVLLRLVGVGPLQISCHGASYLSQDVADATVMNLTFPGNVQAHVFVSWLHPFKEHRLVVVGEHQMAVFDDTAPHAEKLVLYPHRVDWVNGRVPVAHKAEAIPVPLAEVEPLRSECMHFLDRVSDRRPPLTGGREGVDVVRLLDLGQRSLAQGGRPLTVGAAVATTDVFVHPTATVDDGAVVGDGTRIWHYSHVMPGAHIGNDCSLGQNVFVGRDVRVGDRVKIQNNVSVYEGVELEDGVFCGPSAVFTNVLTPRAEVERKDEFLPTRVRRGATLGANCTIVCGTEVGRYAFVGAGAVVTGYVPDHALVTGVPARVVGWMCECGERLSVADDAASCARCGRSYRLTDGRLAEVD